MIIYIEYNTDTQRKFIKEVGVEAFWHFLLRLFIMYSYFYTMFLTQNNVYVAFILN